MWYNPAITLSHNCLFNLVVGARSCGKTFNSVNFGLQKFLKTRGSESPYEIAYVRRYKNEIKATKPKFLSAIKSEGLMDGCEYRVDGDTGKIDKQPFVHFFTLSTANQLKSVPYPNVKLIIFDEFLIDKKSIRYLPGEVTLFLDLYVTIARGRDVPVLLLANSISQTNPYYAYFNIKPNGQEFQRIVQKNGCDEVLLHTWKDTEQVKNRSNSRFGMLVAGTEYGSYAIENEYWLDNDSFIERKDSKSRLIFNFIYNDKTYGVWCNMHKGKIWIDSKSKAICSTTYVFTCENMRVNTLLAINFKNGYHFKLMRTALSTGCLYYDCIDTKNVWLDIVRLYSI